MISQITGLVTRREGRKFLRLSDRPDDSAINPGMLRAGDDLSLYVHIPFCRHLCPFCCFNRYLYNQEKALVYFVRLRRELEMYLERGFHFSSAYFGGGTPTVLMPELLKFLDFLRAGPGIKDVSLETNPDELTPENIGALKDAGIKRLSIGVQSFQDEMMKAMGRTTCSGAEIKERLLKVQGQFETLNIDLIFNFPFQTPEKFREDVRTFKSLGIDQVTFYPLMPSPHKKSAMERKFSSVKNSAESRYYDIILEEIVAAGYKPSTVWCFSRGERMIDEYIVEHADYIGIGSGSVSLVGGRFYVNSFSLERYGELLEQRHFPVVRWRQLSEKEYRRYYFLTKLFGTRVNKPQFRDHFGQDIHSALHCEAALLKLAGTVSEDRQEIRVNRRGMHTVSVMMREFFAALNTLREYAIENQI